MEFPVAILDETDAMTVVYGPMAFTYGSGVGLTNHPQQAWSAWSGEDWAEKCPLWRLLPVRDTPPATAGKRAVREPEEAWTVEPDAVTVTYQLVDLSPAELAAQLNTERAVMVQRIDAERDRRMALGALHQGKRFSLDETSRTDLNGMATTAALVTLGLLSWPAKYAEGWIALDNTRLPLPTPQDGITLGNAVGVTHAALVQRARTLKDMALASADLAAIDPLAGWPD